MDPSLAGGTRPAVDEPTAVPVTSVVPVKALRHAKSRLDAALTAPHRRELTGWMLERVAEACRRCLEVADVLVVAGDEDAARLARSLGVTAVVEPRHGLPAAMATADRLLAGTDGSLVLTADLPLVTTASVERLVRAAPEGVVVAESVDGGTSGLLRRPATVVATRFGPHSAQAHLELARRAGVRALRLRIPELALDIDDAAALRAAAAQLPELAGWLHARGLGMHAAAS